MRLAERHRQPAESHFTEGEPDLEAPEELAIAELGEDAMLEEELDNEDVLEQDVDEDTLEVTLEDLVHGSDDDEAEDAGEAPATISGPAAPPADEEGDPADDDTDFEEALDLVMLERLALTGDDGRGEEEGVPTGRGRVALLMRADAVDVVDVAPCGPDEFVCRSCFLVRKRVQRVGAATVCRDCSS
jgi:hypothetical protein